MSKAVLEASWNWSLIHDLLEQIEEVVLAHPLKTRRHGHQCSILIFRLAREIAALLIIRPRQPFNLGKHVT
jgi:hypothetical protein